MPGAAVLLGRVGHVARPDLETLRARAAALPDGSVPDDLSVRFSVRIDGAAGWTLTLDGGRASVEPGHDGEVVVHLDGATADAVAEGTLNAQQALASGRLRIDGDLATLPGPRAVHALGALLGPDAT